MKLSGKFFYFLIIPSTHLRQIETHQRIFTFVESNTKCQKKKTLFSSPMSNPFLRFVMLWKLFLTGITYWDFPTNGPGESHPPMVAFHGRECLFNFHLMPNSLLF